jgi:hypothetical protein
MVPALVLAFLLLAGSPAGAQTGPRFAGLQVDLWPEYDRRNAVLVILKGELAPDIALPATVSLRVPASSEVTAVAFANGPGSQLFNLAYDRSQAGGASTVQFKTSQRLVHVEFYDPVALDRADRRFTYVWPGDFTVDRLTVRLQEPATAGGIQVKPQFGAGMQGPDGLAYRTAEFGALDAGRRLPIEIRYAKSDPRTSLEILESGKSSASSAPPISGAANPDWLLVALASLAVLLGLAAVLLFWRGRRSSFSSGRRAGFCQRCGSAVDAEDRFCAKCGAALRKGDAEKNA